MLNISEACFILSEVNSDNSEDISSSQKLLGGTSKSETRNCHYHWSQPLVLLAAISFTLRLSFLLTTLPIL
ncbi:hypothetical protein HNY73_022468 [Argiope bruennichi]|uniref:Uncharacterized protein n=1 Tax=Argiope bruennichi TaxID=94029 RepID=A0A8T0E0Y8_ARGBR|nr:hypothetical protein HNY73_022468 [Argiope bruennichi]